MLCMFAVYFFILILAILCIHLEKSTTSVVIINVKDILMRPSGMTACRR